MLRLCCYIFRKGYQGRLCTKFIVKNGDDERFYASSKYQSKSLKESIENEERRESKIENKQTNKQKKKAQKKEVSQGDMRKSRNVQLKIQHQTGKFKVLSSTAGTENQEGI